MNLQIDGLRKEGERIGAHADEGWKLANERTRQWKEQERLNGELKDLIRRARNQIMAYIRIDEGRDAVLYDALNAAIGELATDKPKCRCSLTGNADLVGGCPVHASKRNQGGPNE